MMSLRSTLFRHGSLGRRILLAAALQALVLLVALVALLRLTAETRIEAEHATTTYLEEQRIADRITTAVTRQLATGAATLAQSDPAFREEFARAGEDAYVEIRRYLFRELSAPQRLQLEAVREQHQRMEVAAARAIELADRGQTAEMGSAADAMIAHGLALQGAVGEFLRMRQDHIGRVAMRQATIFRYLHYGLATATALMLLAIALMARFLFRRLATPLAELSAAAHRVGAGDLGTRVELPRGDEMAALANAFNVMTDRLAAARRELEDRNRQLEDALHQLRETQAELVQTEKLSAMGRMMAGLAHELNNPLASVLGYGQLAMARADDDQALDSGELAREYVAPIVAEAGRARQLVHDLLGLAREPDLSASAVRLAEAMEIATRMRAYAFEQAGLELRVDEMPDVCVRADAQRLQQSLLKLITNAFEAMLPAGHGTLAISARVEEPDAIVILEDDGPGLPAAPDLVFEPFFTTKPVGEGTGLGLTLVHRFMVEVGGTIVAENRPGGGARFVLTFQVAGEAEAGPARAGPGISRFISEKSTEQRPAVARPGRVLVVEDEGPLRELQRRLLSRVVETVLVAEDGLRARQILEADPAVDLVISDVKMPGGDGLDLFRWIEAERPHLVDRFLFVTGHPGDGGTAGLAESRADQFVYKPFDMADYVARVTSILETRPSVGGQRP